MNGAKDNTYVFSVPTAYIYTIDADTEEEARDILADAGGLDLFGELVDVTRKDYQNATLEESYPNDGK